MFQQISQKLDEIENAKTQINEEKVPTEEVVNSKRSIQLFFLDNVGQMAVEPVFFVLFVITVWFIGNFDCVLCFELL